MKTVSGRLFGLGVLLCLLLLLSGRVALAGSGEPKPQELNNLESAASSGNPSALNALGTRAYEGRGEPKDLVRARSLYRQSARKGSLRGARNYGWMLWKGEGGPPDPGKARRWLQVAANGGDPRAMNMLGAFYLSSVGGPDPGSAYQLFLRGAEAGNVMAMFNLGDLYDRGVGVPQDFSQAAHWWRKAAERGDTTAETALGELYERGQGVPKDYGRATMWYRRAASAGNPLAREDLAAGPWKSSLAPRHPLVASTGSPRHGSSTKDSHSPSAPSGRDLTSGKNAPVGIAALPVSASSEPSTLRREGSSGDVDPGTRRELALLRHEVETLVRSKENKTAPRLQSSVDRPDYQEAVNPDSYAVVVGVESYPGGVPAAPFADRDARAVMRHLEALGVPPDHIRLLTDALATRGGIDASLRWLRMNASSGSTVYFYYSGHGIPGTKGEPYLAPSGVMAGDLEDTAYPVSRLTRGLAKVEAGQRLLILDACFAGSGPRSFSGKVRPVFVESAPAPERGLVVLSAVSGGEESGVRPTKGHGLFTYYLLKGLNGGALVQDHVTIGSLYRYARGHVASRAHLDDRNQLPSLLSPQPEETGLRLR